MGMGGSTGTISVDINKEIFTTGEAAEICKISQQTIIRRFDAKDLGGFIVPGSKFRRIPREELIAFMKRRGIPLSYIGIDESEFSIKPLAFEIKPTTQGPGAIDQLHNLKRLLTSELGDTISIEFGKGSPSLFVSVRSDSIDEIERRIQSCMKFFTRS